MKPIYHAILCATTVVLATPHSASAGEWGIGLGLMQYSPPQAGVDQEIDVLPFPFYEGERLSAGFGELSYALIKTENAIFAVEGQVRFDGYDPDDNSDLAGMEERDPAFDLGFSWSSFGLWGEAQFKVLGDITNTHEGYEISAAYQYPYQVGRWTIQPGLGVRWDSKELVNYYYGVRVNEAGSGRASYTGHSATNAFVGLTIDYKLSRKLHLVGGINYTRLGDGIESSPIIDKTYSTSAFSALLYRF